MADRLGLEAGKTYPLTLGESFAQQETAARSRGGRPGSSKQQAEPGSSRTTYHSIRYDFKPASLGANKETKPGSLSVDCDRKVTVDLPNNSEAQQNVNYSGHLKEGNPKECVLLIDRRTGEIKLERISSQIRVKKTRPEKTEKTESIPKHLLMARDRAAAAAKASPNSALPSPVTALSSSSTNSSTNNSAQNSPNRAVIPPAKPAATAEAPRPGGLAAAVGEATAGVSLLSSDSSSSSSSSSSDSDSDSSDDDSGSNAKSAQNVQRSAASVSPSMPLLADSPRAPAPPPVQNEGSVGAQCLKDDLRLSESESSSDDEI